MANALTLQTGDIAISGRPPSRGRGLILAQAVIAAVLLGLRWTVSESGAGNRLGEALSGLALLAVALCLAAAFRTGGGQRKAWLLIAAGSSAWSFWYPLDTDASVERGLVMTTSYLLLVVSMAAGVLLLCRFASGHTERMTLALDSLPPAVALGVVIWVLSVGPFVFGASAPGMVRIAAVIHGAGSVALLVIGVAGALSMRRNRLGSEFRVLLTGTTLLAVADAFWLQRLTGSLGSSRDAAMIAFAGGFVMVGVAAAIVVGRTVPVADSAPEVHPGPAETGWESQLPNGALIGLLLLAGWQALFGEGVRYGTATTIAGALAMLSFVLIRQSIVLRRDRHLRQEIGALSQQIDGLISQVGRDPLTGLLNYRAIHERIDHELARGRAEGQPVAVVLIDVDNFKNVNDTLGHQAGDRVLRAVASILEAACRVTDVAARYAGDEFMLLLPGLNEANAGSVCARIAQEVQRINGELALGQGVRVSLSVGVAVTHRCQRSVAQTVAVADAAMYDAKESGKNRVVVVNADTLLISETHGSGQTPDQLMADSYRAAGWSEPGRRVS